MHRTGPSNLITDVPGLSVGNAHDARLRSGVTVLLADAPMTASIDVRGGAPGTRESHALEPDGAIDEVHAVVLSGGSAFGLDAATGVQSWLRERGIGFSVGGARVPIVPQAILFDLLNGGDTDWGNSTPYQRLAREACDAASTDFALGTAGAGYGASTANLKGGLGSASEVTQDGATLGALIAVNAAGVVNIGEGPHFWAAPFEIGGEYGARGWPTKFSPADLDIRMKAGPGPQNSSIAIVATDVRLDKAQLRRLAIMAHTGLARAIYPVNTPIDGDVIFAVSTCRRDAEVDYMSLARLGSACANVLARATARGVFEAAAFEDEPRYKPAWRDLHAAKGAR
ncbi:MAG: P1 family peptidase [Pseudomonadota bacterium]|nr:P1 family peptidase [Pseudomonadota bacterium]